MKMTIPTTQAYWWLDWAEKYRDGLKFQDAVVVGQLVYAFNKSDSRWHPYWVVDVADGKCQIEDAYTYGRIDGIDAENLGIPVRDGKTYQKLH